MPKYLPRQINEELSKQLNKVTRLIESQVFEVYPQSVKSTVEDQLTTLLLES